ncbi:MAG: PIN domain-containing protein [Oscillospiraceae bacterium]|nr:PIN domain-containing protein [Oscillospiraceae bacterium]
MGEKMRIFLVDYENVHCDGIAGVDTLAETDEVVIFYSENANTITFEMMHKLMFSRAKLSYYKVRRGGRNALDFQMSSYLGYLINACAVSENGMAKVEFFLISKDAGFDFVIDFWESGNINVKPKIRRFYTIKAMLSHSRTKAKISPAPALAPSVEECAKAMVVEMIEPVEESSTPAVVPSVEESAIVFSEVDEKEAITIVETTSQILEVSSEADAEMDTVVDKLLSEARSPHELYIGTVKRFGQKRGVEIYHSIKSRFFTQRTG